MQLTKVIIWDTTIIQVNIELEEQNIKKTMENVEGIRKFILKMDKKL